MNQLILAPGRHDWIPKLVIFKLISEVIISSISCEITLRQTSEQWDFVLKPW